MNAATRPRRRQAARRFARVRSSVIPAVAALTSRRAAGVRLLELVVDLRVDALQPARQVLLRPGQVLADEALERLLVRGADPRDRRRQRVRVAEDVEEGLEAGQRLQ